MAKARVVSVISTVYAGILVRARARQRVLGRGRRYHVTLAFEPLPSRRRPSQGRATRPPPHSSFVIFSVSPLHVPCSLLARSPPFPVVFGGRASQAIAS